MPTRETTEPIAQHVVVRLRADRVVAQTVDGVGGSGAGLAAVDDIWESVLAKGGWGVWTLGSGWRAGKSGIRDYVMI